MNWLTQIPFFRQVLVPLLDILILTFILYQSYRILVQTRAFQLVKGALAVLVIYAAAFFLNLTTLLWVLNFLAPGLVIGIAIVFQPELRKIFTRIGQGQWFKTGGQPSQHDVETVLTAAEVLAGMRRGCLIVFQRNVGLKNIIETGTKLNADLSSSLILTVFENDTPLHDGAMILQAGKILAAGCFLPLSEQTDIRKSFGTRHRAALGLAEESDAVVVVASEETGALSLAYDANLYYNLTLPDMKKRLRAILNYREDEEITVQEEALEK